MTDDELARLVGADYQAYVDAFGSTPGVEVLHERGVRIRRSDLDDDYLNGVFGAQLDAGDADARIRETIDLVGRGGTRAFRWSVWPSDTPDDLGERLQAAGLTAPEVSPLMACDLAVLDDAPPPPAELDIREAVEPGDLADVALFAVRSAGWEGDVTASPFAATFIRLASERPPRFHLFGGRVDGELVSVAGMSSGIGVAGIYAVATTESMRGRGYGRALTVAAMAAGRAAGLTTATLIASELGLPVYRRIGFRVVGRRPSHVWKGRA